MHVLFTTSPAIGHFHPLVPMAQALEAAGRVVAFASSPSVAATVEGSGFRFFPLGPRIDEIRASDELQEYAALTDPIARRELIRRRVFVGLLPRLTLPDLLSWCDSWSPDLVISENCEFAGRLVAERLDIPHATLKVDEVDTFVYSARSELVPAMDALRVSVGLATDPEGAMLYPYLYLLNEPLLAE